MRPAIERICAGVAFPVRRPCLRCSLPPRWAVSPELSFLPWLNPHQKLERSTIALRRQQRWRNKDAFRSRQTLLPRKIFRLDRDQSARGRGSGDEGRHSCGVCWACFASAVRRCSRRAAGKPADRGKFQSMLSREARGASNEPLLRLDAWMALIFSTWSFPAMAHRAPSDAFLVFTRPRPLDRDQRGRLTTA